MGLLLVVREVAIPASEGGPRPGPFFAAMYVIALGTGGIKPNVSTFGADQFDDADPTDAAEKERFFGWFYWAINLGAALAFTVIAYLCQNVSFAVGYAVPAAAMGLAILVFLAGTPRYRHAPPPGKDGKGGSVLGSAAGIVGAAAAAGLRRACGKRGGGGGGGGGGALGREGEGHSLEPSTPAPAGGGSSSSSSSSSTAAAAASASTDASLSLGWFGAAAASRGGAFADRRVADVWSVCRLAPFLALLALYWAVYSQMSTTFFLQACQMDLRVGPWLGGRVPAFEMPIAALNLFDTIAVLLVIPLCDRVLFPALRRRWGLRLSMLQKVGGGFVLAVASMVAAAVLEVVRVGRANAGLLTPTPNPCFDTHKHGAVAGTGAAAAAPRNVVALSVLWQVPQFFLIGTSEVLSSITAMEFFFAEAPASMRSLCAALNLSTSALGSLLVALTVPLARAWLPDDLNKGRLAAYYWVLAAAMLANLALFVAQARAYRYRGGDGDGDGDGAGGEGGKGGGDGDGDGGVGEVYAAEYATVHAADEV